MKAGIIVAVSLATAGAAPGCTSAPPPQEPGPAALGQTVTIGPLRVTPRSLLEDSRCPQAVRCAWAGRVRLAASVNGTRQALTLGQPAPLAGGALMLASVEPARRPDRALRPNEYRFAFRFEPGR